MQKILVLFILYCLVGGYLNVVLGDPLDQEFIENEFRKEAFQLEKESYRLGETVAEDRLPERTRSRRFPTAFPIVGPDGNTKKFVLVTPSLAPVFPPTLDPSDGPSRLPTYIPTKVPTCVPTTIPSLFPSVMPSVVPSLKPTTIKPTLSPSVLPTLNPTTIPSLIPTVVPSQLPIVPPTVSPSLGPTVGPSMMPSKIPSVNPSLNPSIVPSVVPTVIPSVVPSLTPSVTPTGIPTAVPTAVPTPVPTAVPTSVPTLLPTVTPSLLPTLLPTLVPTAVPTAVPTIVPSIIPTVVPTLLPTLTPSVVPTVSPTVKPSVGPSLTPTVAPTQIPVVPPTVNPSLGPTVGPSVIPSKTPSVCPSIVPSIVPSVVPSVLPTVVPTVTPSLLPVVSPTVNPSVGPTVGPSVLPSKTPSVPPTVTPSAIPSVVPTVVPSLTPSVTPTGTPTVVPTLLPVVPPTVNPSVGPSVGPSLLPSKTPTVVPTVTPSVIPTLAPTVIPTPLPIVSPTVTPTVGPSVTPSTLPSVVPSSGPTVSPTVFPSLLPSVGPSRSPSVTPSVIPSAGPSVLPSLGPSALPTTLYPSLVPVCGPSVNPTLSPSVLPTVTPSLGPTILPSTLPSVVPSVGPTKAPSLLPTLTPTVTPSVIPSALPTVGPSVVPSVTPSMLPSAVPSLFPTVAPSRLPTVIPTSGPSLDPSGGPTAVPSVGPSAGPTTLGPSLVPVCGPSVNPSLSPSVLPSVIPSVIPSALPTVVPSGGPSTVPSVGATAVPTTLGPSLVPVCGPSVNPTLSPSVLPSVTPSLGPSIVPSVTPSLTPSLSPTVTPSVTPSTLPTVGPSIVPSVIPSVIPSTLPTVMPSGGPTVVPSVGPSAGPTTLGPSLVPVCGPSMNPTLSPSVSPSVTPSLGPTTSPSTLPSVIPSVGPTRAPSLLPTVVPSVVPSVLPSVVPSSSGPSVIPSVCPSVVPVCGPSVMPTLSPTVLPSLTPTLGPTTTPSTLPSVIPSVTPSIQPSAGPSVIPSLAPSVVPSRGPTLVPSVGPSVDPSVCPTVLPSVGPSALPTTVPSLLPSVVPVCGPSAVPTLTPSSVPSVIPSLSPSLMPSVAPSRVPTLAPTVGPSAIPSGGPSVVPSLNPSVLPTVNPTTKPSVAPTTGPTLLPTLLPSCLPTMSPSVLPSAGPSVPPSVGPTTAPSLSPSIVPSGSPSVNPSLYPTLGPTVPPTRDPTVGPSVVPSVLPSVLPSVIPTAAPSLLPSVAPSLSPSRGPTVVPTVAPTVVPTQGPTELPSETPSVSPSVAPSVSPSIEPSIEPSTEPSVEPSIDPSTVPTERPTESPSVVPTTAPSTSPTKKPTVGPSVLPSLGPSVSPSISPSIMPSVMPSQCPSVVPTANPSFSPTTAPSLNPSVGPSVTPSVSPSDQPSLLPSTQPSVKPSETPSVGPTTGPSRMPSVGPSVEPSVAPTNAPTLLPSVCPSMFPSQSPSIAPSAAPTVTPTTGPSVAPSVLPTEDPSVTPTLSPSRKPSIAPTVSPTVVPTKTPSTGPTVKPSLLPSLTPTDSPALVGSKRPSVLPTSQPSVSPKTLWVAALQSSLHDLSLASSAAAHQSNYYELVVEGSTPTAVYGSCPAWTSFIRGDLTQSSVVYIPSVLQMAVLEDLTESPTILTCDEPAKVAALTAQLVCSSQSLSTNTTVSCGGHVWMAKMCAVSSSPSSYSPSLCVDCADPCLPQAHCDASASSPGSLYPFTFNPCVTATCSTSSASRVLGISFKDVQQAPAIVSLNAVAGKTSLSVDVQLASAGSVYCGVFLSSLGYQISSVNEIVAQNNVGSSASGTNLTTIVISNLNAVTSYSLYCLSVSPIGVKMPLSAVISSQVEVVTQCCKTIQVSQSTAAYSAGATVSGLVTLSLNALPSSSLLVNLNCQLSSSSNGASGSLLFPNSLTFSSSVKILSGSASVYSLPAGVYTYSVSLSGPSAEEYEVLDGVGRTFTVLSVDQPLPAPKLISAAFAVDGSSLTMQFDSSTNRGGTLSSFVCSALFDFPCASSSQCQWAIDSASVTARITEFIAGTCATPGSSVSILPHVAVKAQCSSGSCASWQNATAASVAVPQPVGALSPTVVMSAPFVIGSCDSLTIDITGSTGSGGRQWSNRSFVVQALDASGGSSNSSLLIQQFLNIEYKVSPPTAIPRELLRVGMTYNVLVTLCNFLNKCSQNSVRTVVLDSILPTVSILGPSLLSTTAGSPLSLTSSAFVASCVGGVSSSVGLTYRWSVLANGVEDVSVSGVSQSKDPSKLLLSPFTLSRSTPYQMRLTVSSSSTSASTTVNVVFVPGALIAVISGGLTRSLHGGESTVIDASLSYDQDIPSLKGTSAGLVYSWSCTQTLPVFSASCESMFTVNGGVTSATTESLALVALSQTAADTATGLFTVIISDVAQTRSVQSTVTVSILADSSPILSVVSNQVTGVMNAGQLLQLTASVTVPFGQSANVSWSVDASSGMDLATAALSPVVNHITAGSSGAQFMYLAFGANALPVGASLSFKLTCLTPLAVATTSIAVTINAPPQLGSFDVSPSSGVALSQTFTFAAAQWVDPNLPITYQFGYLSNAGAHIVMKSQSPTAFGYSQLSAGLDSVGNVVYCLAQVFDSLNANTSVSSAVTVSAGAVMSAAEIDAYVAAGAAGTASADSIKQFAALSSSVLNVVDCSSAPNCSALNRQGCFKTPNTCGSCSSDAFVGVAGSSNTACVPKNAERGNSVDDCRQTSDCSNLLANCVNGHCEVPNKECVNGCSGHGVCAFYNTSSAVVSACALDDNTCIAVCLCESDYSLDSVTCGVSNADLLTKQASREVVINSVGSLFALEDPSEQVVAGWTSSLIEVTQSSNELSASSTSTVLDLMASVVGSASDLSLTTSTIGGLMTSMDSLTSAIAVQSSSSSDSTSVLQVQEVLQGFTSLVSSCLLPGMAAVSSSFDQFQLVSQFTDAQSPLFLPMDAVTALSGSVSSSVALPAGSVSTAISLVSVNSQLFGGSGDSAGFTSNPVSLTLSSLPCASPPCAVNITLQNTQTVDPSADSVEQFNTTCKVNEPRVYNHTCENGLVVPNITCSGLSDYVIHSRCPVIAQAQVCNSLTGSVANAHSGCTVVDHSPTSVTCSCFFGTTSRRRVLVSNDTEGSVEQSTSGSYSASYVAMLSSTTTTFVDTFKSADNLNNAVIEKGWKVLVTLGTIAVAVLVAILVSNRVDDRDVKEKVDKQNMAKLAKKVRVEPVLKRKKRVVKILDKASGRRVVNLELALVEQSLPKMLSSSVSFNERVKSEIKRHHRWFCVVFLYSDAFPRALRVASLATNVIIMLFIQSITYNLTNPDDGSCEHMSSVDSCLSAKSSFATGQTKCGWDSVTDKCYFVQPDGSIKIVLFVAIFSAIISTPIALLADWVIRNLVSAPVSRSDLAVVPVSDSARNSTIKPTRSTLLVKPEVPVGGDVVVGSSAKAAERWRKLRTAARVTSITNSGVSPAHIELSKLADEIRVYRSTLLPSQLTEFDYLWGLDEHGCFQTGNMTTSSVSVWNRWMNFRSVGQTKTTKTNVHQTVLTELREVKMKTDQEIAQFSNPDGTLMVLDEKTKQELGRKLMFLFQCDLLPGLSGQILASKGTRDFGLVKPVQKWKKIAGWSFVALLNAGMLFYVLLFALDQTVHRQSAWFKSFILWLFVEICFVSTGVVIVTHILLPSLIMKDVTKIKHRLLDNIRDFHANLGKKKDGQEGNDKKPFNAAAYLFVSTRLAAAFPDVRESGIISQFSTPWPRQSYQRVVDVAKTYNRKYTAVMRSFSIVVAFFLTNLLNIPPTLQDMVIHMITTTSIGYTILLHINLFHIFPVLVIVPFLILCVIVHFFIHAGKAQAKHQLAKLMPTPVKSLLMKSPTASPRNQSEQGLRKRTRSDAEKEQDKKMGVLGILNSLDEYDNEEEGVTEEVRGVEAVASAAVPRSPTAAAIAAGTKKKQQQQQQHTTRRQSVSMGVQLLHQMQAVGRSSPSHFSASCDEKEEGPSAAGSFHQFTYSEGGVSFEYPSVNLDDEEESDFDDDVVDGEDDTEELEEQEEDEEEVEGSGVSDSVASEDLESLLSDFSVSAPSGGWYSEY